MGVATCTDLPSEGRAPSSSPEAAGPRGNTPACELSSSCQARLRAAGAVAASSPGVVREPMTPLGGPGRASVQGAGGWKAGGMELRCRGGAEGSSLYMWLPLTHREEREAPSRWP